VEAAELNGKVAAMPTVLSTSAVLLSMVLLTTSVRAGTLEVGPDKQFKKPSQAIAAARDGDTIEIAAGTYLNDWTVIRRNNLKLRGSGGPAVLKSQGMISNGKAIWVIAGDDISIENVEFRGARVRDRNGAGIRQEGRKLTLRNCRFIDNENGILGGRHETVFDIQHCEFAYNSLVARPGTHNLYVMGERLVFQFNYSHHAKEAHLLKSRTATNIIKYNRLSDEGDGSSSYVINLPNAGRACVVGNILHQGPNCQNRTIVAYGEEGPKGEDHEFLFINNTVINDCQRGSPIFVSIRRISSDTRVVLCNNIFAGKGRVTDWQQAVKEGNFEGTVGAVKFIDREKWDLRLKSDSPCRGKAIDSGKANDGTDLTPVMQYLHPLEGEKRPSAGKLDIGAHQHAME
jgi:hypothetical protein